MSAVFLSDFKSVSPKYQLPQSLAVERLIEIRMRLNPNLVRSEVERRIRRFGLANAKIQSRGSEVKDYTLNLEDPQTELSFFKDQKIPLLETRMALYEERAAQVFSEWYLPAEKRPNHLVHVSCTGYTAPSVAQKAASEWSREGSATAVTHAYHMGCYASLPAIRIAQGFALSPQKKTSSTSPRVDIAHNELCSLHFDPLTLEPEQIVVQSLFADGHIRYSLGLEEPQAGFKIEALDEVLVPDSTDQMTWTPTSTHFKMQLSRLVPESIRNHLKPFVQSLLAQSNYTPGASLIYAVHPGGPKIIDAVEEILELGTDQTSESHAVLASHGNMSSATLPHIWQRILQNPNRREGTFVVSLAFGPGLTLSGGVFRICRTN